ncbi:hypothetical protein [Sphingomonas turrisvirgatae]|uniref:Uncharacterized protein n=1 Tax=Sphingomonas turrisvirgatae TaxID=1888892 RepID=A0A1E3LV82_9SPHN|nr:hypothetical protein [Sphingomonas turrisvirgatae]ODP36740.1 hypothetical protein BFL28_19760 [Sphingomonas turrisvirgatae]
MPEDLTSFEATSRALTKAFEDENHESLGADLSSLMVQLSHLPSIKADSPLSTTKPHKRMRWLRSRLRRPA